MLQNMMRETNSLKFTKRLLRAKGARWCTLDTVESPLFYLFINKSAQMAQFISWSAAVSLMVYYLHLSPILEKGFKNHPIRTQDRCTPKIDRSCIEVSRLRRHSGQARHLKYREVKKHDGFFSEPNSMFLATYTAFGIANPGKSCSIPWTDASEVLWLVWSSAWKPLHRGRRKYSLMARL